MADVVCGMKLEPLKAYRVTSGNTDGSINTGNVIWLSEDGSLNVMGEGVNGFYTHDELTPEIMDFEAVLCNVYRVVKNGNDELLIMREATPEERESVQKYINSISERVVPYRYVEMICEILNRIFACPCDFPRIEEYMFEHEKEWCQDQCCYKNIDCWKRYFELQWKERSKHG